MNPIIPGCGFHHVAIRASDFDRSVQFYSEGLGFQHKASWGTGNSRGILLNTGDGNYIEIFAGGSSEPKPEGHWFHIALRTEDVALALDRARSAGAEVTVETRELTLQDPDRPIPIRIGFCKGPDGELIEFFQNELT